MSSKPIQSICILRLSAIGDVCNAVAAVQAIQRKLPEAKITWIIGKLERQLLVGLPGVTLIEFDKRTGRKAAQALKRELKNTHFDVLLHMQVAMRANYLASLINARRKIGYDWGRAKEGHSLVVSERIEALPTKATRAHVLDGFMDFAMKLGLKSEDCYPPQWHIPVSEKDQHFADQQLSGEARHLVICPAASKRERCASPELYAEIAHYAERKGLSTVLCGGPAELDKELADAISKLCKTDLCNLVGKTSLKQMYAILGKAALVVCPDTGPAHMANAQNTPVIGLYAHSNPRRTGPYNYLHLTVNAYDCHLNEQTGKSPDQVRWGARVKGAHLMDAIDPTSVFEKIDQVLLDIQA